MTIRELIVGLQAIADKHGDAVEPHVLLGRAWHDVTSIRYAVDDNGPEDVCKAAVIEFSPQFGYMTADIAVTYRETDAPPK